MDKNKLAEEEAIKRGFISTPAKFNFTQIYIAGFDAALTEISKSGEFREFWLKHHPTTGTYAVFTTEVSRVVPEYSDKMWQDFIGALKVVEHAALMKANAKIQELEKELKLEKMRGDHNSYCPNHQETKGLIVTEEFKANGVVVDCQFYKCPECEMTWLSGRQEHDVDMKIKSALESKIQELEEFQSDQQLRVEEAVTKSNNLVVENVKLQDKITELEQQLKKAESVIEFYANTDTWSQASYECVPRLFDNTDEEIVNKECVGGKLARQYLKSRVE